ncbi:O-unit flippase-like protein [Mucilaginibacter angelicae]|uniref:O-unit flippase-like protein n=1 Tax=Mucilaginibacter angelicae TaxID=869718 RepID=A0ABV6L5R6_9SPHI
MNITKTDVLWNYAATFFKISSSVLLLPIILHKLPSEDVGIWSVFSSIAALVFLIDFGFNSSFSRNVTYVFSGVNSLLTNGHDTSAQSGGVNYSLLKGLLSSMRWFYSRVSLTLFLLLLTLGTFYISRLLNEYHGNKTNVYIAWGLFIAINTYNLYTLYYDALLEGKGLIRVSKQITILGHLAYLLVSTVAIYLGFGLIALVLAQLISIIIIRTISQRKFFNADIIYQLQNCEGDDKKDVLKAIYPNAVKYGITSLGGFMIQKSSIFIGSLYLSLSAIASFGITKQMMDITVSIANIAVATFLPQIANLRIGGNYDRIKAICIRGVVIANLIFITGAATIIFLGTPILHLIKSNTNLNQQVLLVVAFSSLIGLNSGISGAIISTKNHIPFVKPSILSGVATILLLIVFFKFTNLGLLGMAMAPGLIDLCYQGWKWPLVVIKELNIKFSDFKMVIMKTDKPA